jgi:levansucrase
MKHVTTILGALGAAALITTGCTDDATSTSGTDVRPPENYETTLWTAEQVGLIRLSSDKSFPVIDRLPDEKIMPGYWVWDTWPVLTRDNVPARINGHYMLVSLTAPDSVLPGKRHDIARYRYMISQNGADWQDMGYLFNEGDALGARQWAGSTIYDAATQRLTVFYTATGTRGETPLSYTQRIAQSSARLANAPNTVRFDSWEPHRIVLSPDLRWYAQSTGTDAAGIVFAFRDPSYFRDPATGLSYLTFTGRIHDSPDQTYNGNVGIAVATDASLSNWRLLKPIIAAPEGMYGWTSESLFGPWEPMNGSALMLHNPASAPDQTYSYQLLNDLSVLSFVNFIGAGDVCGSSYIACGGDEEAAERAKRFGGTLARSVLMRIDGTTASIAGMRDNPIAP